MRRRRLALGVAVAVGLGAVLLALMTWGGGADDVSSDSADDEDLAVCLGTVLGLGKRCSDLRQELSDQDPEDVDVVLLVPDQDGAERVSGVMLDSVQMWQSGLAGIDAEVSITPDPDRVGDGSSAHPLLDPEVVLVAASVAGHDGAGSGRALDVYDSRGERCAVFPDAFSLTTWRALPGFQSHHSLPEGLLRQPCADGGEVCIAVNATLDPDSGVSPFEAFTLLGDELGHCLRPEASGQAGSAR